MTKWICAAWLLLVAAPVAAAEPPPLASAAAAPVLADIDAGFRQWRVENHVPGLVWGVVGRDGRLLHLGMDGLADVPAGQQVSADTRFRIASMTKAFTAYAILGLRDAGKLHMDDPVPRHIPETAAWAGGLVVADLAHHLGGFVTDDPWGDRQTPLPAADFSRLLQAGVPFARAPGLGYEYSNLGFAMLGRIIDNVSGQPFDRHIASTIFTPLGMASTTFHLADVPAGRLAHGYRWEDGGWKPEPDMAHGAFGAMGGVITTAPDYARWLGFLLNAWPAPQPGVAEAPDRARRRALLRGEGSPSLSKRPGEIKGCTPAVVYGMGLRVMRDCALGLVAAHSGGYPGYGSHMLLLPDAGVALFAFANRTYAGPAAPVWDAALKLDAAKLLPRDTVPVSPALKAGFATARAVWDAGTPAGNPGLAMNFLMDRDAAHWAADIAALKASAGDCAAPAEFSATSALEGRFIWQCAKGSMIGYVLLAPTPAPQIQTLELNFQP